MHFYYSDSATTVIYTLSLHDALPILSRKLPKTDRFPMRLLNHAAFHTPLQEPVRGIARKLLPPTLFNKPGIPMIDGRGHIWRSEEHTSELQSRPHLVCRLLLEKKKVRARGVGRIAQRLQRDAVVVMRIGVGRVARKRVHERRYGFLRFAASEFGLPERAPKRRRVAVEVEPGARDRGGLVRLVRIDHFFF